MAKKWTKQELEELAEEIKDGEGNVSAEDVEETARCMELNKADTLTLAELCGYQEVTMETISIDIDCAPATPRPDTYIGKVGEILGITEIPNPVNKFFGNWTWEFEGFTKEQYDELAPRLKEYLFNLYDDGKVRYAAYGIKEREGQNE